MTVMELFPESHLQTRKTSHVQWWHNT